jgi:hypothetical protein
MPQNVKTALFCLVLTLTLVASGVGDAGARKHKKRLRSVIPVSSQISLDAVSGDGASGFVSSDRSACLGDRLVTLYQENSGPSVPSSFPVATTRTRDDGSWTAASSAVVGGWLYPGQYWADVQPKQTKRFSCHYAASNEKFF